MVLPPSARDKRLQQSSNIESLKKGGAGESGFCYEAGASVEVAPEDALLVEEIQSTWWLIPGSSVFEMKKNVKSVIGTRDDKQWPTEGGALKDGFTGVADASARASWCVCRVAQATIPSLTARRVTGEIEKLTPSSRRAEGASLLEHLRSRSSAAPAPCDRADPLGSTDDEVRMGAQPPLVVVVSGCGCFFTISQLGCR